MFKSIEDANKLRSRLSECFERASLPGTSEDERKKLLSFVVVGEQRYIARPCTPYLRTAAGAEMSKSFLGLGVSS